ncbi:hypothetical protein BGY98DRAFT_152829 [Russula aff. rugulosa BPL654]|nr:hypothetical protein BGY98DRAFT_152829 [Russula aff. rugulosa BPL654]
MQCLCTEDSPDGMTMYPRSPCIVRATVVCLALCITATPVVVILRAHAINEFRICMGQSRVRRYWITYVNERTNLGSGGEYPKNPTVYPLACRGQMETVDAVHLIPTEKCLGCGYRCKDDQRDPKPQGKEADIVH